MKNSVMTARKKRKMLGDKLLIESPNVEVDVLLRLNGEYSRMLNEYTYIHEIAFFGNKILSKALRIQNDPYKDTKKCCSGSCRLKIFKENKCILHYNHDKKQS